MKPKHKTCFFFKLKQVCLMLLLVGYGKSSEYSRLNSRWWILYSSIWPRSWNATPIVKLANRNLQVSTNDRTWQRLVDSFFFRVVVVVVGCWLLVVVGGGWLLVVVGGGCCCPCFHLISYLVHPKLYDSINPSWPKAVFVWPKAPLNFTSTVVFWPWTKLRWGLRWAVLS